MFRMFLGKRIGTQANVTDGCLSRTDPLVCLCSFPLASPPIRLICM